MDKKSYEASETSTPQSPQKTTPAMSTRPLGSVLAGFGHRPPKTTFNQSDLTLFQAMMRDRQYMRKPSDLLSRRL
jgi:hypothetical protein